MLSYLGAIPYEICQMSSLYNLEIANSGNTGLTCTPVCVSSILGTLECPSTYCPTEEDNGLCALIAATNVASLIAGWGCSGGYTSSPPCSWWNLICDGGGNVVAITFGTLGVSGINII